MDSDPVATPVDDEVVWEGPVVHTPHVIVTLDKRSIQPLFLNESVVVGRGGGGGKREASVFIIAQLKLNSFSTHKHKHAYTYRHTHTHGRSTAVQLPFTKWLL